MTTEQRGVALGQRELVQLARGVGLVAQDHRLGGARDLALEHAARRLHRRLEQGDAARVIGVLGRGVHLVRELRPRVADLLPKPDQARLQRVRHAGHARAVEHIDRDHLGVRRVGLDLDLADARPDLVAEHDEPLVKRREHGRHRWGLHHGLVSFPVSQN
ncbi:MAG: hypothetical protein NT062_24910 [Proteobacteria bacterium]|nr:hypothetical protein [Pseudomonadota bacterium]